LQYFGGARKRNLTPPQPVTPDNNKEGFMDTGAVSVLGLFAFIIISLWTSSRREQREMEFRYELYRRMLEHPGPEADAVRGLLAKDEQQRDAAAAARKHTGGLTLLAVGIGSGAFFYFIAPKSGVYVLAMVPILVGLVMLLTGSRPKQRS
jgi:hypothetical protein